MKLTIILALAVVEFLGRAHGFPVSIEDLEEDSLVWPIPQRNGSIIWMTEEQALQEASVTEEHETIKTKGRSEKIRFFLYTQANPTEPIEIHLNDEESLRNSPFDGKNPTRFMIHGWMGDHNNLYDIREALLLNGKERQINFISVDWSVYSGTINYISAKNHCSKTGKEVAEFIDWLHNAGNLSYESLGVYGHSLGAHVAGFAGKNVKHGRVGTIVGLDPAMPLFRFKRSDRRLAATDAEYVETIHTNGGFLGFYNPIGQSSFYPNGGKHQPGCGDDSKDDSCSHGRSVTYFAEALRLGQKNGFTAIGCSSFDSLKTANCNQYSTVTRLGDPRNAHFAKGIYYLETNSDSPYGIDVK